MVYTAIVITGFDFTKLRRAAIFSRLVIIKSTSNGTHHNASYSSSNPRFLSKVKDFPGLYKLLSNIKSIFPRSRVTTYQLWQWEKGRGVLVGPSIFVFCVAADLYGAGSNVRPRAGISLGRS